MPVEIICRTVHEPCVRVAGHRSDIDDHDLEVRGRCELPDPSRGLPVIDLVIVLQPAVQVSNVLSEEN